MIFKEDLDAMGGKCDCPECQGSHEENPVFLHARCHVGGPMALLFDDEKTTAIVCVTCNKIVTIVALQNLGPIEPIFGCASYLKGEGLLRVTDYDGVSHAFPVRGRG